MIWLGGWKNLNYCLAMSTVIEIESAIRKLSREELRHIQDLLDDILEDEMEFTDEFKASIERGKRDLAEGRVRHK